jgi:hypothetical protein
MKWNHLPVPGGLYAQHPKLIDQFRILFRLRAEHEEKKHKEDEAKRKRESRGGGRVAGRGSRRR